MQKSRSDIRCSGHYLLNSPFFGDEAWREGWVIVGHGESFPLLFIFVGFVSQMLFPSRVAMSKLMDRYLLFDLFDELCWDAWFCDEDSARILVVCDVLLLY